MDDIMFKKCESNKLEEYLEKINKLESVFSKVITNNQSINNKYLLDLNDSIKKKDIELSQLKADAWDYILKNDGKVLLDIENNDSDIEIELDQQIYSQLCTTRKEIEAYRSEQNILINGCNQIYELLDELANFLGKDDKTVKNTKTLISIPNVCRIDKKYPLWNKNTNEIKLNITVLFKSLKDLIHNKKEKLRNDLIMLKAIEFDKLKIE